MKGERNVRLVYIRWLIFAGLAAFAPLFYYLAVVGGFLPYGGILLIGVRNLSDHSSSCSAWSTC